MKAEETAEAAALAEGGAEVAERGDIVVLRVDYFENYAGRFLSVEAKDGTRGASTTGESLVVAWNTGAGTAIDQGPRTMNVNIDPDTTPDTYIEHRILVKVGEVNTSTPAAPTRIRIGSSNGAFVEADVNTWLGGGLPPMASNFLSNFTTRYLDPTEVYGRFRELAAEFPDLDDDHPAAAQDERVPAAGAGADGGPDEPGLHGEPERDDGDAGGHPHPRGRGATRAATTSRPSSSPGRGRTRRSR